MQVTTETVGLHTVYRLLDDTLNEVIGEAVISESEAEIRLHGIFVQSQYRRQGHGTSLMETILSLGETKAITLCTDLGNIGFFRRFGFEVVEVGESLVSMERRL